MKPKLLAGTTTVAITCGFGPSVGSEVETLSISKKPILPGIPIDLTS
jgi:hypothetical protein